MTRSSLLALLLVLTSALHGDETRLWTNNTDQPWTVKLVDRSDRPKEQGNMNFTDLTGRDDLPERPTLDQVRAKGLKDVALGENFAKKGGARSLILPPRSRWLVEFTTTNGSCYHTFSVEDLYGHSAGTFILDKRLLGSDQFKVIAGPELNFGPQPSIALNAPMIRDFAVNPGSYKIVNGTKTPFHIKAVRGQGAAPKASLLGRPMVKSEAQNAWLSPLNDQGKGTPLDQDPEGQAIPPGAAVELWADGKAAWQGALEVSNDLGAGWTLGLTLDPGKPYPACAAFQCPSARMVKKISEASLKDLAERGVVKLELK